ncbi:DNA (cytosine-5-)-methyltransferase [Aggregatibacter sp. oral taxon 513]|uniref:DNA cytosine methyltransferase n=1 Tax=Aggregatibacter sp. oral taxon 513 TaxID=712150 RepID=UPI001BAC574C|nr:DNA (cytosine-5-)-methyltransferase [Aggregatibacter sp. oral taxon 513]QUC06549.1 DNA (cytosine-5-)-methyltransferase [Aggregatibacter sp. oral taxon 513]
MKYSALRQKLDFSDTDQLAHLTHYLHNGSFSPNQICETAADYFSQKYNLNIQEMLPLEWDIPFPKPLHAEFTFIDLFAGIGGFRIPLQELGGQCVFSSEFNSHAQKTYEMNFGEMPFGDITAIPLDLIPQHDVLCAGFPCQPFSISGKMKGFEDTRGTLIYNVFQIIEAKKPKVVFLENVKHLVYHDNKRTLQTIIRHLEELGYFVQAKVLNATDFGLPQNRERIIIIASQEKAFDFSKLKHRPKAVLKDFLDKSNQFEYLDEPYTILTEQKLQKSGLIFAGYRNKAIRKAGVREGTENLSRVHKQPNRIYSTDGVHPALPSQESSGRFWIWHDNQVRKLTINECYRIMGFPDSFKMIDSKSEQYRQIGNSVAIPMIKAVGEQIKAQFLQGENND